MKSFCGLLFLLFISCFNQSQCQSPDMDAVCISANEANLAELINDYRKEHKLSEIPISASLTHVAQLHVRDLSINKPFDDKGKCNMHSWSKSENWSGCCYNSGADGECMWDKPGELTQYKGDGYEIVMAEFNNQFPDKEVAAIDALIQWQKSPKHDAVIRNKEIWGSIEWNAMGVEIYKGFAAVWLGREIDKAGSPKACQD